MDSATVMGTPYGNKISFMATGSGMSFGKDVGLRKNLSHFRAYLCTTAMVLPLK
jgi:hypothetical protein